MAPDPGTWQSPAHGIESVNTHSVVINGNVKAGYGTDRVVEGDGSVEFDGSLTTTPLYKSHETCPACCRRFVLGQVGQCLV